MKSSASLKPRFFASVGLVAMALALGVPSVSLADDKGTPPTSPNGERPPLRGERKPGGADNPGAEGRKAGREGRPAARPAGLQAWVARVKELKLTDDQVKQIDAVVAEFEKGQKEWKEKNGAKAKELDEKARTEREAGAVSDATKKAITELNASRPKATDAQEKITKLLTEAQKTELAEKAKDAKDEAKDNRREEARKKRGENGSKSNPGGNKDGQDNGQKDRKRDSNGTGAR